MKKISQIILYTVLGVVVLGLILTSVLKKDFAPNIAVPTHTSKGIEIRSANVAQYDGLSNEEKYNEFVDIYSDSYKLTILYSVFSGEISRKQEISNYGKKAPDIKNGYIVTFNYSEPQTLKVNGEDYIESVNSNTKTTYNKVVFNVLENKGLRSSLIYFYSLENDTWYKLTTLANFDSLYDFISELSIFAPEE